MPSTSAFPGGENLEHAQVNVKGPDWYLNEKAAAPQPSESGRLSISPALAL